MTKADIAKRISTKLSISKKESADLLELVIAAIKESFDAGEHVKIPGFGKFEVKQKKDRKDRNPQTGETMTITARKVMTFKPSAILRTSINKG